MNYNHTCIDTGVFMTDPTYDVNVPLGKFQSQTYKKIVLYNRPAVLEKPNVCEFGDEPARF